MFFYKIEAKILNMEAKAVEELLDDHNFAKTIKAKINMFNEQHENDCFMFVSVVYKTEIIFGAAVIKDGISLNDRLARFVSVTGFEIGEIDIEECTLGYLKALCSTNRLNNYCGEYELLEKLDIGKIKSGSSNWTEKLIKVCPDKDELLKKASRLLCQNAIIPEIERIYTPVKREASGHPVHYIIQADDDQTAGELTGILLSALYANNRLKSRRYSEIKPSCYGIILYGLEADDYKCSQSESALLYKAGGGGAVVADIAAAMPDESDIASTELATIEAICKIALKYRNETLTIFRLPRAAERLKNAMREHLDSLTLVELQEDDISYDEAKIFLKQSAREYGAKIDSALYKDIKDTQRTYSVSELKKSFRHWYDNQLRTKCYTQYADLKTAGSLAAKNNKPKGDAYTELEKMIGLTEAKDTIRQAVDYFKAQKLFKDRGIPDGRPALHMVFKGSPGTAKTSAARLFARIMKDNGLLSVGSLIEVGRSDLVGKYVGWTAQIVKQKFKQAKGSVLFIDEAYALCEERGGMYGDEAINTIVQEMENMREDIVVIFAGYPNKMDEFLSRNPGLSSRIAFHIPFVDYSADELLQILELMAENNKITLDDGVAQKALPIITKAMKDKDFGNGRFIRNLFESARMKHAARILTLSERKITKKALTTLTAADFEPPKEQKAKANRIGFM